MSIEHRQNSSHIGRHTNKSVFNGSSKILTYFIKSLHAEFQEEINEYFKDKKKKIQHKIFIPIISKFLKKGVSEKLSFFNTPAFKIFSDVKSVRKEQNNYNKDILTKILKYESNDKNCIEKKLNIRFNAELNIYLKSFLNDEKNVIINNKEIKLNDKFKTLKDFYQENKSTYTEDEIKKIKEYIYKIIDGKIESRKEKSE